MNLQFDHKMWPQKIHFQRHCVEDLVESPTEKPAEPSSRLFHHQVPSCKLYLLYLFVCLLALCAVPTQAAAVPGKSVNICTAEINVLLRERTGFLSADGRVRGRYGLRSPVEAEHGRVVHLVSEFGRNDGCTPAVNTPGEGQWIALVQRGGCRFADKIHNAAMLSNASAVVVYDDKEDEELITMNHEVDGVVSVFIQKSAGEHIAHLVNRGLDVYMNISVGYMTVYEEKQRASSSRSGSRTLTTNTPVLVVSLCIIVALIVGLVSLLVYGLRRSRKNNSRHRAGSSGSQRPHSSRPVVFLRDNIGIREGLLEDIAEEQAETASTDSTDPKPH